MKQIVSIKTKEHEFIFDQLSLQYLFSSFYIFLLKEDVRYCDGKVKIKGNQIFELKEMISNSLIMLLSSSYVEPSIKELQKNPTRFEKININEKIYKVNYRLSDMGRLAYTLYSLILVLGNAINNNEEILLLYKNQ